jgi:molecular chaperone GrpE (heat shock protein)
VDEHEPEVPLLHTLETQVPQSISSLGEQAPDPGIALASSPPTPDDCHLQSTLDNIKSLNEEQLSFQRSSHALIVDLSNRVKQIVDEGSSRERRAVLLELVLLHDSLEQVLGWVGGPNDLQPKEAIVDRLETLRVELLEILMRREVRPYDGTNDVLDRRLHRAVKTVPTSDPSLNDRVKTVVRAGFFWREQVLRPEEVIIFKYKPELLEES